MLVSGHYKEGDKLPSENELSEKYGVSRNTVRAALNKLKVLGFTETKHGGGTTVRKIGSDMYMNFFVPALLQEDHGVLDVLEFRKGIEVQAVRLAAERADEKDILLLRELLGQAETSNISGEMRDFAFHNTNFHAAIAKASHNSMFEKMMEIISSIIMLKMQDFLYEQGHDIDSAFYHKMVFECILNNKPDEAAFFMDKHLTKIIDRVKSFSERSGEALPDPSAKAQGLETES